MLILVSYDIVDDKKRAKLAKKLLNYGQRVQYSVFECDLKPAQFQEMKKMALRFMDKEKDSLRFYKICEQCEKRLESFGIERAAVDEEIIVV